jgi:hypothetical protein
MVGANARLGVGWSDGKRILSYAGIMAAHVDEFEKLEADRGRAEHGYDSWKRAKIERGLMQAQDRSAMITVEQVLRALTVDGQT